jgi:hypothetical protein
MKEKSTSQSSFFNLRVLTFFVLVWIMAIAARATTITVTNTDDSGPGSLRQALIDANDGDTINFDVTGTIELTSGALAVDKSLTISGPGANLLTVSAGGQQFISAFQIMAGHTVVIEGLTISGGGGFHMGGISNAATLTLANCVISESHGASGISNAGMLTILNSTINNNHADEETGQGGGINNVYGTVTINNSSVNYNSASGGGGISSDGTVTITDSTIVGNFALGGGGISARGTTQITNSTISGNTAGGGDDHIPGSGGGIFAGGTLTINNSTISWNTAWGDDFKGPGLGGGIYFWDEIGATTTDNILSYNSATEGNNIYGAVTSFGYNVCTDDCGLSGPGDLTNTDPLLGPLQDNGGPTFTHALLPGSPAIDAGNPRFTPPPVYDQRGPGFRRVRNRRIDIGSFEVQAGQTPRPRPTPAPRPTPPG